MRNLIVKTIFVLVFPVVFSFTTLPTNDFDNEAKVSWYGAKFHGKLTASGEVYNMNEFSCAHKTLKFGTKVEFKNPKNGKTVIATVNDRGPFVKGRTFDLSKAAFNAISDTNNGVIKIKYKIIKK